MQVREGGKGGRSEGCGARGQIKKSRRVTMTPPCSINIIVSRAKKKNLHAFRPSEGPLAGADLSGQQRELQAGEAPVTADPRRKPGVIRCHGCKLGAWLPWLWGMWGFVWRY